MWSVATLGSLGPSGIIGEIGRKEKAWLAVVAAGQLPTAEVQSATALDPDRRNTLKSPVTCRSPSVNRTTPCLARFTRTPSIAARASPYPLAGPSIWGD